MNTWLDEICKVVNIKQLKYIEIILKSKTNYLAELKFHIEDE